MLQILQKGLQVSIPIDPELITGNPAVDSVNATIVGFVAGKLLAIDSDGYAVLADGDTDETATSRALGFIVRDAAGYFYENKPALASGLLSIAYGPCKVISDQIGADAVFTPGSLIYAGTNTNVGLLVAIAPDVAAVPVGIALNAVTQSVADPNPELTLLSII